jgi:hypothetical protein
MINPNPFAPQSQYEFSKLSKCLERATPRLCKTCTTAFVNPTLSTTDSNSHLKGVFFANINVVDRCFDGGKQDI